MTTNLSIGEAYYMAMNNKDIDGLARCLHPEIHFLSPLTEFFGKEQVVESTRKLFINSISKVNMRAKFSSGDLVMFAYDLEFPSSAAALRVASLLTFKDNLISNIELFFDAGFFAKK